MKEIIDKTATPAMLQRESEAKLLPAMSRTIFQQDGPGTSNPQNADRTYRKPGRQDWWGIDPDLPRIENLWAIIPEKITKMGR